MRAPLLSGRSNQWHKPAIINRRLKCVMWQIKGSIITETVLLLGYFQYVFYRWNKEYCYYHIPLVPFHRDCHQSWSCRPPGMVLYWA